MMRKLKEMIGSGCFRLSGSGCFRLSGKGDSACLFDLPVHVLSTAQRKFSPVAVVVLAVLVGFDPGWPVAAASAVPRARVRPTLKLGLEGPQTVKVGQPLEGLQIKLVNPGAAAPASRLRLFIHGDEKHELTVSDIRVDVKEGKTWREVPVEPIDGGVMGALGTEGRGHKNRHKRGGFAIARKMNRKWIIRVTFRKAGRYVVLTAVSPDNGSTHLAQPVSLTIEAL